MTRVITSLKCCWLGIKNLNKLVLVMKNWPDDLGFGCTTKPKSIKEYLEIKNGMVLENEDLIVDFNLFEDCFWVPKKFGCIICEEQNGSYLIAIGIWFFIILILLVVGTMTLMEDCPILCCVSFWMCMYPNPKR